MDKVKPLQRYILFILIAFAGTIVVAHASDEGLLFVQKCGSCHQKGAQAKPINPADKAGLVWKKYFNRNRHPIDLSQLITNKEMSSILFYLEEHAADSDLPIAAAIPK